MSRGSQDPVFVERFIFAASIAHEIAHKNSTALILPNNGRIGLRGIHTLSAVVMRSHARIGMTKNRTGEVWRTASVER